MRACSRRQHLQAQCALAQTVGTTSDATQGAHSFKHSEACTLRLWVAIPVLRLPSFAEALGFTLNSIQMLHCRGALSAQQHLQAAGISSACALAMKQQRRKGKSQCL